MYVSYALPSTAISDPDFQHGAPLEILDMGETSLDEDTFDEYLSELKEHYTADKVKSDHHVYQYCQFAAAIAWRACSQIHFCCRYGSSSSSLGFDTSPAAQCR